MRTKIFEGLERVLVTLIVCGCFVPLVLTGYMYSPKRALSTPVWMRNLTLSGVQVQPETLLPTQDTILSAKYQAAFARNFDRNFPARELAIRCINEIYLRVLHTSPVGFLVGPHLALFEHEYLEEYCIRRPPDRESLQPLVDDLVRFQAACEARGVPFVFVLTPSKPAIYPEWMPLGWSWRYNPKERYYDGLVALLKRTNLHFIDGHVLAAQLKDTAPTSVFPIGGMHWGDRAVLNTTNAMLSDLAEQGLRVQPLKDYTAKVSDTPEGQDGDVASALNILWPLKYPVEQISVHPVAQPVVNRPNIVFVGGSFLYKVLDKLGDSHEFHEIDSYFYHHTQHLFKTDSSLTLVAEPAGTINYATDFFAADGIVLEANEETMFDGPKHVVSFLHEALTSLPDQHLAKAPFHYFSQTAYQWGQTLSLLPPGGSEELAAKDDDFARVNTLSGFSPPGGGGSWTVGHEASIFLQAPPPVDDMVLDIDALPARFPPALTEQRAQISVNGQPVGEMVFSDPNTSRQSLTVPRAVLGDGGELIELHLERPGSPAEFGLGSDQRVLGLLVAKVNLHLPAGANVYQWGETLSFDTANPPDWRARVAECATTKNFSPDGWGGAFTVGELATLNIATPPMDRDMTLDLEAMPYTHPPQLAEERVEVTLNGESIGQTVWPPSSTVKQSLKVPARLLAKGGALLEFHVAHPMAPSDFGNSNDGRKLGILVARVRFHEGE